MNNDGAVVMYRGFELRHDRATQLWTATRPGDPAQLPRVGRSGTLRALIDQLLGPEVRECCTGGACDAHA